MISTAGNVVICSACGQLNPADHRFCGMCGSRLPHRAVATPDEQSGISLTQNPPEVFHAAECQSAALDSPDVQPPGQLTTGGPSEAAQGSAEHVSRPITDPLAHADEQGSPPVFSEALDDPQLDRPEMAAIGETLGLPSEILAIADALPAVEPSLRGEAPHFEWMDDVLEEIEVEAAKSSSQLGEPQFPDALDELPLPSFESTTTGPNNAPPPFREVNPAAAFTSHRWSGRDDRWGYERWRNKWRMLLGIAAILVFAVLGALQWRSYRNDSDGPVEFVLSKIQELMPGYRANSETFADSQANNYDPAIQAQEQTKPQDPSASGGTKPPDANPVVTQPTAAAASQVQSLPPTGTNAAATPQVRTDEKTHPPETRTAADNALPAAGSKAATAPQPAPQSAPSTAEKSKPSARSAQGNEQHAVVSAKVPGGLEMSKAKLASDSAAQAAWLWKATAKGNPDAPVNLADMYISGEGVPRSCEQAVVLLKTAAINANAQACNRLASMYATGTCVQPNHVEAYRWLSSALAADPHSEWARQNRDLTWQQMTPEERTQAEKYR